MQPIICGEKIDRERFQTHIPYTRNFSPAPGNISQHAHQKWNKCGPSAGRHGICRSRFKSPRRVLYLGRKRKLYRHFDPRGIPGVDLMHSVIQPACIRGLVEASQRQAIPIQVLRGIMREHLEKNGAKLLGDAAKDVVDLPVEEKSSKQKKPEFGTTESQKQMEALHNLMEAGYKMTCEMRMDVKEIKAGMKRLSRRVEDLRSAVLPRLRELFTFVKEGEGGKLPRMFVLTEDHGLVRRVVCRMVPGLHKLQLELLCECRHEQAHLVDGQSGLSITTLNNGLLKRGLPYINGFLKVAYAATKIGAHIAAGCNDLIPDFTKVLADIADDPEFGPSARIDLRSGQQWLSDVLLQYDCNSGQF
ncbi:hypothetical protein GOP47_0009190 [Adiantum capillus-veneris]|uniref:Uncharacterized protein n=1 Tax=Adiantum capillus-veneris TaxID=13818 RepID=A0A9D4ZH00_ADICA|nr:hypothetical protein GOP47_0009190 [Adiantum capillus-veneris]